MSYNMMIGYDIYDCFTMEHFRLRQRMTLTTKIYCSRLYIYILTNILWFNNSYVQIFFHGSYFAVGKTMIYLIMTRKVFVFLLMRLGFAFLLV
jgi:hypothetical protein